MPGESKKTEDKEHLIYVIAGQDESLVNARCSRLLDEIIEPAQRATGLFCPQDDSVEASELLDELRTAPFLTGKRVVLLKQADAFISRNRELLEKYFDNPCPTGRLVMSVKNWDTRTKLAKKLPAVGELISLVPPKRWEIPKYLTKYAAQTCNKVIHADAAELIIELTGDELPRLYNEIDKLALFVDSRKDINRQDVELLLGNNRMFNAFAVIDAVIACDAALAVSRLRAMFETDKSTEFTVIGAFAYHLRRMFKAKAMLDKGIGQGEVEKKLYIWNNKEQFFSQLKQTSLKRIGLYIRQLAQTDYEIKTGRSKVSIAMEQLVLKLCNR
jgi:DNA polymerase III subunit delta